MRALLAKEWRENRKLLWAFVVLAPLLSLGLKQLIPDWRVRPDVSFAFVLPAFFALYVMAIGADLVAGDAGSGRFRFLATLPVRPAKIWAAKVVFLFLSAALFIGYALAVESVIFTVEGSDLWVGFTESVADEMTIVLAVGLVLAAAVVLWSTLIDHGLAAVLGALLTLGGLALGAWFLALSKYEFRYATTGQVARLLAVPAGAFLLGSLLAFAKGRIHLGGRLRRVGLAAAAVVLVLAPPAAWAAMRLARWSEIRPGDADVGLFVDARGVSPDGRWVLVHVQRRGAGPFGVSRGRDGPAASFAVSLADGRVTDLTGLGGGWHDLFPEPGHIRLYRQAPLPEEEGRLTLEVLYDLEAGEVISTRPLPKDWRAPWTWKLGPWPVRREREGPLVLREGREPLRLPAGSSLWSGHGTIGVVSKDRARRFTVHLVDAGRRIDLPGEDWSEIYLPSDENGSLLGVRRIDRHRSRLVRLPLAGGPEETIRGFVEPWWSFRSPDGRRGVVALAASDEVLLLDADRGVTRVARALSDAARFRATWAPDSDSFLLETPEGAIRGDFTGDRPAIKTAVLDLEGTAPFWYDGERALVLDRAASRLLLLEPDSRPRQLLPVR